MVANGFGGEFEVEVVSAALSKKWSHTLYRQAIDGFGVRPHQVSFSFDLERFICLAIRNIWQLSLTQSRSRA